MRPLSLIVMRCADMHRVHPNQDNTHVCPRCGEQVGIYPSGQAILANDPSIEIVCNVCHEAEPSPNLSILAPGAEHEPFESVKKKP